MQNSNNVLSENSPCWMRNIEVRLYSKNTNKYLVYGGTNPNQLTLNITGEKKVASAQDTCTVAISNLTYEEIIRIQYVSFILLKFGQVIELVKCIVILVVK